MKKMINAKKIEKIIKYLFLPVVLVLYCFYDINRGVDLSDTGYNMECFYNFLYMDGENILSTFWSNYVGWFFTRLPAGDTWLGMMFYCTLIVSAIVLVAYFLCIEFLNFYVVFVCEIVAISIFWIPAPVLYDSLTFLLLEIAILLIHNAIKKERNGCFFSAGVVLGINTLVRMPNVTQVILILLVWLYAWFNRDMLKQETGIPWVVTKTGICVVGYIFGLICSVVFSLQFCEINDYMAVFTSLLRTSSVEGYGLGEMAFGTIYYIFKHFQYILLLGLIIAFALVQLLLVNKYIQNTLMKRNMRITVYIFTILASMVMLYITYWKFNLFSLEYSHYSSIRGLMASIFLWGILMCIANTIYKRQLKVVMISLLYLLLLWIIPLGSNNQIYLNIGNSFLLLPIICWLTNEFMYKIEQIEHGNGRYGIKTIIGFALVPIVVLVLIQTIAFECNFIFGDSNIETSFQDETTLYGMQTSQLKVEVIESLIKFMQDNEYEYSGVLQYCGAPGLLYVLQETRGIEHSWPELDTYSLEAFEEELLDAEESGELPLIILDNERSRFYERIYEKRDIYVVNEDIYMADKKLRYLIEFIDENNYVRLYDDEVMYAVYVPNVE